MIYIRAISEKKDGSMRVFPGPEYQEFNQKAEENRKIWLNKINPAIDKIVSAGLVHGGLVEVIGIPEKSFTLPGVDGLVTNSKGVALAVTNADCPTMFVFDPVHEAVGIAHCGWKGILAGIVENTIEKMQREYGSDPRNIEIYVGPGIQSCHFQVREDVAKKFSHFIVKGMKSYSSAKECDIFYVDLYRAIEKRLALIDVHESNIKFSNFCTYCTESDPSAKTHNPRFFSYRRDHSDPLQTQMGIIMLK